MVSLGAITGVVMALVQAGAAPVHNGSPPPLTVTLLAAVGKADAATSTGTVMVMSPVVAPDNILQPANVPPVVGQVASVAVLVVPAPATIVGAAFNVIPVGKTSSKVMSAMVALPAMVILMV